MSLTNYITGKLTAMYDDPLTSREQAEHEEMERLDEWAEDQHQTELELHAKELWAKTARYANAAAGFRSIPHRLEILARSLHKVSRYGAGEGHEPDYQMDLLLTEWGAGKLIAYFGALAETEGQ
jgi:hypothetical protein